MDPGTADNEFLGLDIGNNGAYRRLKTWSSQDADGEWHLETLTLSGDQISNGFTLRFFGIAQNNFTTFAIDNVMIAATPGSVVVTPITPEQTPDLDETVNRPDLTIKHALKPSASAKSGAPITFYPRVENIGTASAPATTIRIYRHTQETATPRIGGTEEAGTARSAALAPTKSALSTARITAPTVTESTTHYYYLCLDNLTNETQVDNNCTPTPATVTTEQGENGSTSTTPTPTTAPDVTVTETVATPPSVLAGDTISIQATIINIGSAAADATTIRVYRHEQETTRPTTGGIRETNTASTPTLAPNKSVQVTSTHQAPTAPSILGATTYYYYVCLTPLPGEQTTNNNCSSTPAIITARPKREDPGPPYGSCLNIPDRGTPMGGDAMPVKPIGHSDIPSCGTITLGGLETETGVHGFVVSAHVITSAADRNNRDFTTTDVFVGHDTNGNSLSHFLGKVYRMPKIRKIQSEAGSYNLLPADAAFVAYPHPKTPGCSLTWSGDGEEFCLDVGAGEYLERVVPLTVRGADGTTHTVIGSKEPTEGLTVRFFGSVTGVPKDNVVESTKVLSYSTGYNNYANLALGSRGVGGDSGAPVYTVPDAAGNVHIAGIVRGSISLRDKRTGISFISWSDVEEELDLKPISAPDGLTEEEEADLAGLFSAFD